MAEDIFGRASSPEQRFASYVDAIVAVLGHAGRGKPARAYCTGLLLPGERKSVEPMAARIAPDRVPAAHQSLHHLVAKADWSDAAVLWVVRAQVLPVLQRHGPIRYWMIDDTAFPKKGRHSVGVARQYCGQLGKQDNCQVAVTLSVSNDHGSLPIAYRLYLPEDWANDPGRRACAGVPEDFVFKTKPQIALDQIDMARGEDIPSGIVLADAGYGNDSAFRAGLTERGLPYIVGIQSSAHLWPAGTGPLPPQPWRGKGRPPKRLRHDPDHQPASAKTLAEGVPAAAWRTVRWREGTNAALSSRFAALRVRPAHRDEERTAPHPEEWLLLEWPDGEAEPAKYWLSSLPDNTDLADLVAGAKARWRIERDFQDLKQEIGLGHYEGRNWRGFHHHASLCIAAYGFLVIERGLFPPGRRAAPWRPSGLNATCRCPTTVHRRLVAGLVRTLPRCPCCLALRPERGGRLVTQ